MIILRPLGWVEMALSLTVASPWILKKNTPKSAFSEEQCEAVKLQGLISAQGMLQSKTFRRPFWAEMSQRICFDVVWTILRRFGVGWNAISHHMKSLKSYILMVLASYFSPKFSSDGSFQPSVIRLKKFSKNAILYQFTSYAYLAPFTIYRRHP